jgi:hypothetical protein
VEKLAEKILSSIDIVIRRKDMVEKKFKQVCHCKNCGNEAEMMITCSLEPEEEIQKVESKSAPKTIKQQTKGHAACSHCGNESEIWLDL